MNPLTHRDPVKCAEAIVDRLGRTIVLGIPNGIGKPNRLVNALYGLAEADRGISLKIYTGLTLVRPLYRSDIERRFVAPLLDRLFASWPDLAYAEALRKGALPPNIEVHEFFLQAGQWLSSPAMQQSYASLSYSHVAAHLKRVGMNVMAQLLAPEPGRAPGEPGSRLSLSSNPDIALDIKDWIAARRAAGHPMLLAGEINANLPYMPGEAEIDTAELDLVLAEPEPHFALFAPPKEPVSLSDYAMGLHAATLVKDGGTLQIGIGSFADAVAHALVLRHTRNALFRELLERLGGPLHPEAELTPFWQGLYGCSEMLVDGFLALRRAGILKRMVVSEGRRVVLHAGFFLGSEAFYRELREMSRAELEEIAMTSISFTNTLLGDYDAKAAQRRDARFINTALTATLLGAISADQLEDGRVVSGVGGQGDFVTMAHDLPGARAVIAVRSSRGTGLGRRQSNIVWRYANTSVPRQLRDVVVTEYGIADVRGVSDREVVAAMLAIADSAFQPALRREAVRAGKLPGTHRLPSWAEANRVGRITEALSGARRDGMLPPFPFGTEMTETEQALLPALGRLKGASPLGVAGMLARGARAGPSTAAERAGISRLFLDAPQSLRERAMRALVLGAMRR